jgi:hypothetical protein
LSIDGRDSKLIDTGGFCAVYEAVAEAIFAAVDGPALAVRTAQRRKARQQPIEDVGDLEQQLADLAAGWAAGTNLTVEWEAARPVLQQRIEQARVAHLASNGSQALAGYTMPGALREALECLSLDQRRAIAGALIESVKVVRATRRGRNCDPTRLQFKWRR